MGALAILTDKLREWEAQRAALALKIERDERDLQSNVAALERMDQGIVDIRASIDLLKGYGR